MDGGGFLGLFGKRENMIEWKVLSLFFFESRLCGKFC